MIYGRTTGIVVECGEGVTNVVPLIEGYIVKKNARKVYMGGKDVTEYFHYHL